MANLHYDAIVCSETELCLSVTFQSLFIHAMVYDEQLKYFICVYHLLLYIPAFMPHNVVMRFTVSVA